ncbi:MAG: PAS domain S-box protein, partial [Verrucomicrobiae bacterium]|nr:PAS domain S-box protein [Verrucomicrobiae bacterium]NNJ87294.1 PAS domain S-box protein [Akkermansiaceae bacterium]
MDHIPQDRLELALRASNEGVWDWYIGDDNIYYSEQVLKLLGYNSTEEAPNIIIEAKHYFHEDELPELRSAFKKVIAPHGDEHLASDCRYKHPDGEWHWLRIRGIAVRDDHGNATRIVGSIIDISLRKNAEMALEEERYRLKELIENIPLKVYYKDKESRFVMANSSLAEWLGCSSVDELIGKADHDFFEPTHADPARADEVRIMETREPKLDVIECETWDGKEDTWVKTSKLPWLDKKGNLLGTFGISNDITDLVITQRRLAELAEELQKRNIAFEEELQLAREIQQALLPRDLDGLVLRGHDREVTFGCRYSAASEMAGDFFEVMPISQHCIGILVCDVMGHGVRASLIVSMLRGLMEKERDSATSPEWFLHGVNEGLFSIFQRAGVTLFATAIYCVVNLKEGSLQYACAGHPAPIAVR